MAVKTIDQQAALMLHKTRDLLVRQRTMLINALRGHLAEFGIIAAKGPSGTKAAIEALHKAQNRLPELARRALHGLVDQLRLLGEEIDRLEARILEWHRASDVSRRLATIPGIGPITASATSAAVPDGSSLDPSHQSTDSNSGWRSFRRVGQGQPAPEQTYPRNPPGPSSRAIGATHRRAFGQPFQNPDE